MKSPSEFGGKAGEPMPTVSPADLKAAWEAYQNAQARAPKGQEVGLSDTVLAQCCSEEADIAVVAYRLMFLRFFERQPDEVPNLPKDGKPTEAVFRAFAQIPMVGLGHGVEYEGFPFDLDELMRLCCDWE